MRHLILFASLVIVAACNTLSSTKAEEAGHLAWCDSIYHQNVGCPMHGQVEVPPEVQAERLVEYLVWCDSIYHQNFGCPKHDEVEVPPEVPVRQEAEHLAWCDNINHQNVGCPKWSELN